MSVLLLFFLDPEGNEEVKEEQENAIGSTTDDTSQPVMEEKAAGIEPSHEVDPRKGLW